MLHLLTGPVRQVDAEFPKQEAGPGEGVGSSVHVPSLAGPGQVAWGPVLCSRGRRSRGQSGLR